MRSRTSSSLPARPANPLLLGTLLVLLVSSSVLAQGRHGPAGVYRGRGFGRELSRWVRDEADIKAFWPRWFEHNREWILGPSVEARRAGSTDPVTEADRGRIRAVLTELASSSRSSYRQAAAIALGRVGGVDAVRALMARLSDPDDLVAESALLGLGLTGKAEALKPLLKAFRDPDPDRMPWAALGLALLGRAECGAMLLQGLGSTLQAGDLRSSACVITAMQEVSPPGGSDFVDELVSHLGNRKLAALQPYLCHALGRIGGDDARKALLALLRRGNRRFRGAACLALSNWSDKEVIGELMGLKGIRSGDRMTRIYAASALGRSGANASGEIRVRVGRALFDRARDWKRDRYVAPVCLLSGAWHGLNPASLPLIYGKEREDSLDRMFRAAAALGVGLHGQHGLLLRHRLRQSPDENQELTAYAALGLGILGDEDSLPDIRALLGPGPSRPGIARQACLALGLTGSPEDAALLLSVLEPGRWTDRSVQCAAVVGLGILGDRSALDPLMERLGSVGRSAQKEYCIAALGWLGGRVPYRMALLYSNFAYGSVLPVTREVMSIL